MKRKIWFECLRGKSFSSFGTFPFFQGFRYSMPESSRSFFHNFFYSFKDKFNGDYYLRLPLPEDQKKLEEVLVSYGASLENYEDLEVCTPDILSQVASNIVTAPSHGYYLCFIVCEKIQGKVIGFLQLDLYSLAVLTGNLEQFFLPEINKWLAPSKQLTPHGIQTLPLEVLKEYLETINGEKVLQEYKTILGVADLQEIWACRQQFILQAFKSYKNFYTVGYASDIVSNLSYILLPDYHNRGIMTSVIKLVVSFLRNSSELSMFKWLVGDRIAYLNTASISLLKGLAFEVCATFDVYYTDAYRTRKHPNGRFMEPCQALILTLHRG